MSDNLELNKGDQFIIGLDISGSMGNTDTPSGQSRFQYTLETLKTFVREAAKWDPDGVSFYLFGATVYAYPDLKPDDIDAKVLVEAFTPIELPIPVSLGIVLGILASGIVVSLLRTKTNGKTSDARADKAVQCETSSGDFGGSGGSRGGHP